MTSGWIGPALGPDSAADWLVAMGRLTASRLREFAPSPFGLVNDELRLPAYAGPLTFSHEGLMRMTLCYGLPGDPLSPYIEVSTGFSPDHDMVALRFELVRTVGGSGQRPPRGPLQRGRVEIVVAGSPRTAHTLIYRKFHGLQFSHLGLKVTAIARGGWSNRPEFALITDLEPYLAASESADSEVVKAQAGALFRPTQGGARGHAPTPMT